jgi:hypothetical protein
MSATGTLTLSSANITGSTILCATHLSIPTEQPLLVGKVGANSFVDREVSCGEYNVVDDILDSRVQNGIGRNVQKHKISKIQPRKKMAVNCFD